MSKEDKLKTLGIRARVNKFKEYRKYIYSTFEIKKKKKISGVLVYKLKKKISIYKWNKLISSSINENDIMIHVHCYKCDSCCVGSKKKFKRCGSCKMVYFCSNECKRKSKHMDDCVSIFKNLNTNDVKISEILYDKRESAFYPGPVIITIKKKCILCKNNEQLYMCSLCKNEHDLYCSRTCQLLHWKIHKNICK